jgi:hypothetical protein
MRALAAGLTLLIGAALLPGCGTPTPDGCTEQARVWMDNALNWQCANQNLTLSGTLSGTVSRAGSGEGCHLTGPQFQDLVIPLAFEYYGDPVVLRAVVHGYLGPSIYRDPEVLWDPLQPGATELDNFTYRGVGGTITVDPGRSSGQIDEQLQNRRQVKAGKNAWGETRWQTFVNTARIKGTWSCPPPPPCPATDGYRSSQAPACVEQALVEERDIPWSRAAVLTPCGRVGKSFAANLVFGTPGHPAELSVQIPLYTGPHAYPAWDVSFTEPDYHGAGQGVTVVGRYGDVVINAGERSGYFADTTGPPDEIEFFRPPNDGLPSYVSGKHLSGSFSCSPNA